MASPIRPPPPPPAADPVAPSSPPSQQPSRDGSLSPENPAPAPPSPPAVPTTTPPPHSPGDSSPSSPPHPPTPPPPPPLPPSADASPPLPGAGQTSQPRSPPHPSPAPAPPPPPAPASSEAKSEQEAAESASESGSMTLALALTQTEDSMPPTPPKASSTQASPIGSPQKESAVTIAKLLSGEDPAADKVAPPSDPGSLAAAAAVTGVGGGGGSVGSKRWLLAAGVPEKVRRAELRRAELGFRVSAAVFCLVALSVMAADTTTGWSGDSFRRYNEYRYVLAASVVAFTYSGFQLVAEVHYLVTRRHIIQAPWRSYFNLAMDQMLAYLLLSASSAALSRNGVWMSRFGGDQFTKLIDASASMAFLAFIALGLSSIISAYCVFSLVS
ncbi:hypothetical protein SEVIR_5G262300v4 [Setaria viridis]|uniref:CASP-like protein n=1 Tax=Setaria viridis TaxID=4556 RepID=A0A4U6UJZ8_SETVI|nr:CASP-like protein 4A3 [Setaria viridis]TKW15802.1 hypothetical protein SEVIR_5G262300v2 [Setaria viridis]